MSLRRTHSHLIVALYVALVSIQGAWASKKYHHYPKEEPKCQFISDFSTVENSLRSAIFLARTEEAAKILSSDELFSLGAGLRYRDNETCLLVQSSNRARDPDIVAARALAINAEKAGDTLKLARAIVLSFELVCKCSPHTSQEKERLTTNFKAILDNPEDRKEILEFGRPEPPETHHYGHSSSYYTSTHSGRRLSATESSNVDSFVCAYCQPSVLCEGVVSWCPKKEKEKGKGKEKEKEKEKEN